VFVINARGQIKLTQ